MKPENVDPETIDGPASPDDGSGGLVSLPFRVCITAIAVARWTARRRDALDPDSERRSCGALSDPPAGSVISTSISSAMVVARKVYWEADGRVLIIGKPKVSWGDCGGDVIDWGDADCCWSPRTIS